MNAFWPGPFTIILNKKIPAKAGIFYCQTIIDY